MTAWLTKKAKLVAVLLVVAVAGTALVIATDPVLNLLGDGATWLGHGIRGLFGLIAKVIRHYIH